MLRKLRSGLLVILFLSLPVIAQAQYGLDETAKRAFGDNSPVVSQTRDVPTIVGNIISIVLSLLGVIFLLLIVAGGIQWMLAGGDQSKVEAAQKRLANAAIGLALVLTAYALSVFVIGTLITAVTTAP